MAENDKNAKGAIARLETLPLDPTKTVDVGHESKEGTHVVTDTCVTFTDAVGQRTHAKPKAYVSPHPSDVPSLLRAKAIMPAKAFEALEQAKAEQAAAMAAV